MWTSRVFLSLVRALYAGVHPAVADDFSSFKWTALLGTGRAQRCRNATRSILAIPCPALIIPKEYLYPSCGTSELLFLAQLSASCVFVFVIVFCVSGKSAGWGELTSNVLFIGQQGVITPPHYGVYPNPSLCVVL